MAISSGPRARFAREKYDIVRSVHDLTNPASPSLDSRASGAGAHLSPRQAEASRRACAVSGTNWRWRTRHSQDKYHPSVLSATKVSAFFRFIGPVVNPGRRRLGSFAQFPIREREGRWRASERPPVSHRPPHLPRPRSPFPYASIGSQRGPAADRARSQPPDHLLPTPTQHECPRDHRVADEAPCRGRGPRGRRGQEVRLCSPLPCGRSPSRVRRGPSSGCESGDKMC